MKNKTIILTTFLLTLFSSGAFADRLPDVTYLNLMVTKNYLSKSDHYDNFEDLIDHYFEGETDDIYRAIERLNTQQNQIKRIYRRCGEVEDIQYSECFYIPDEKKIGIVVHLELEYYQLDYRYKTVKGIYEKSFELANNFFVDMLKHKDVILTIKATNNENDIEQVHVVWENGNPSFRDAFFNE